MSEDEAEDLLAAAEDLSSERIPLSESDIAAIAEGIADIEAGRTHTTEEVRRRLGID